MASASNTTIPIHLNTNQGIGGAFSDTADFVADTASGMQTALITLDSAHAKVNGKALQVLGFVGALPLITGAVAVVNSWKELNLSRKIKDFWGEILGWSHMLNGGMQTVSGAALVGMNAATIAFFVTAAKTASVAAHFLGTIGGCILGGSAFAGALSYGLEMGFAISCRFQIGKLHKDGDGPEEVLKKIRTEVLDPQRGLVWKKVLSNDLIQKLVKNESPEEASKLLEDIKSQINKKLALSALLSALSITGAVLTILVLTSTTVIAPWAVAAISIALGMLWIVIDGKLLYDSIGGSQIGSWEKAGLYLSALFSVAIAASGVFMARDVCFMAISAVLGASLLIAHLFVFYKMNSV